MMNTTELGILLPAFLAGLLVLATHVPLGQVVLQRGIIFIDLAIAQIAGLGVILTHLLIHDPENWQVQIIATTCAIAGALLLGWTEKKWLDIQEALIGVIFVLSASISVLLLADNPQGGDRLRDILSGQILWVTPDQLWNTAILYSGILFLWYRSGSLRTGPGFYILFALSVTASVQLVGVYLVFSSLIVPALASYNIAGQGRRLFYGYMTGVIGYFAGLILSFSVDMPSGPLIVITLVCSGLVMYNIGHRKNKV